MAGGALPASVQRSMGVGSCKRSRGYRVIEAMKGEIMRISVAIFAAIVMSSAVIAADEESQIASLDAYDAQMVFSRFPLAQVIYLEKKSEGDLGWGMMYADTYGKLHLLRATKGGWKLDWEVVSLGAKVRNFIFCDLDANGSGDIVVATVSGRILVYSAESYTVLWENLEDRFTEITAFEVANIDSDPQLEMVFLADGYLYIFDGANKSRQWVSPRTFEARELLLANIDKDPQLEIVLSSGIVIDSRFLNIEIEWEKPFGDRIAVFDMNSDGYPEIVGEFADYSLRIFDAYARREVW